MKPELFSVLKILSPDEFKQLRIVVKSPLYQSNAKSEKLYSALHYLNQTKMRVLRDDKLAQSHLTSETTHTKQSEMGRIQTVFVPTDLSIEHRYRQTGKVKQLNISQVRANISANKTRLRRATAAHIDEAGADKKIESIELILEYSRKREEELMTAAMNLEHGVVAI